MLPIRIGASPWQTAVSPCLANFPHKTGCLKKPGIELEALTTFLDRLQIPWLLKIAKGESGCGYPSKSNTSADGSGLFEMLLRNEIDITANACSMKSARVAAFDFTYPVYYAQQIFVLKSPQGSSSNTDSNDFGWPIWLGVMSVGFLVALLISWVDRPGLKDVLSYFMFTVESYTFWTDSNSSANRKWWAYQVLLLVVFTTCVRILFVLFANTYKMDAMMSEYNHLPFGDARQLVEAAVAGNIRLIDYRKNRFPVLHTYSTVTEAMFKQVEVEHGYDYIKETETQSTFTAIRDQDVTKFTNVPLVQITMDVWFDQVASELHGVHLLTYVRDNMINSQRYAYMMRRGSEYAALINSTSSLLPSLILAVRERYLKTMKDGASAKIGTRLVLDWKPGGIEIIRIPVILIGYVFAFCVILVILEYLKSKTAPSWYRSCSDG